MEIFSIFVNVPRDVTYWWKCFRFYPCWKSGKFSRIKGKQWPFITCMAIWRIYSSFNHTGVGYCLFDARYSRTSKQINERCSTLFMGWYQKIVGIFSKDAAERRRFVNTFNATALNSFTTLSVDALFQAEVCEGVESYRHEYSALTQTADNTGNRAYSFHKVQKPWGYLLQIIS